LYMAKPNCITSYLGIESGGTRTIALLAPGNGRTAVRAEFGPANLRLLDDAALIAHFNAIKSMGQGSEARLGGIAIGMAGARTESDRERIRAAAGKVWPEVPCYATNDLETALAAGETKAEPAPAARVVVLSGTGSCCFGRWCDDR
jgi:N-acetylmuramic acid 6-phosphate etherase